jgi:hypothetical protein
MIRVVLENVLLFLLPTFIYVSYKLATRRNETTPTAVLEEAPLVVLFVLGALLMTAALTLFATTGGGKPGQAYQPGVLKDGKIEPGRMQ